VVRVEGDCLSVAGQTVVKGAKRAKFDGGMPGLIYCVDSFIQEAPLSACRLAPPLAPHEPTFPEALFR
jgi:hypothetical protein